MLPDAPKGDFDAKGFAEIVKKVLEFGVDATAKTKH